jgi:transposase
VIAGLTRCNLYFRIYEGAIERFRVVEFLKALVRAIKRPLLILWDSLKAHRSRLVRDYVDSLQGRIHLEFLPSYAPELNPVEYIWAWMKRHAMTNFCPDTFEELTDMASRKLRSAKRRPSIILACWKQADLPL